MSYVEPEREEFLNAYFSKLTDAVVIAPHLLSAKTDDEFELWFEKLEQVDRRYLYLFLKKNKDKIPVKRFMLIKDRFDSRFM